MSQHGQSTNSGKNHFNLDIYISGSEMLKEYEDEVFFAHVDKITVVSREEIIFLLKCGLELKERMA